MGMELEQLTGVGIYGVAEAARLAAEPTSTVNRWVKGYTYTYRGEKRTTAAVCESKLPSINNAFAIGFRDLIEIRVVNALRSRHIPWSVIYRAREHAMRILKQPHPFAAAKFTTAGRGIFTYVGEETGDKALIDVGESQYAFNDVLKPYLTDVEYNAGVAARWWPLGKTRRVLLDPNRNFGQPIIREGVPTAVLASAMRAEESIAAVAKWYEVSSPSVRDAVEFENKLAA